MSGSPTGIGSTNSIALWPAAARIALGHAAKYGESWLFDWLVYGSVTAILMHQMGAAYGTLLTFAIMTPLSAVMCAGYIHLYDRSGKDWLGLEALKTFQNGESQGRFKGLLKRVLHSGRAAAFLALSIYGDPFMTTIYMRQGAYNGMTRRDWAVFSASLLVSNGYWTLRWSAIVVLFHSISSWIF